MGANRSPKGPVSGPPAAESISHGLHDQIELGAAAFVVSSAWEHMVFPHQEGDVVEQFDSGPSGSTRSTRR